MEYLPFGETLADEHLNSNNSPFKFNGKEFDEETGNYYYGARYYDPKFSIFISVDPLADKYPGISPYAYCFNNPINLVDPTGMAPFGDYFSSSGKLLGSDDTKDGKIYISSGNSKNFMTASNKLIPGGLRTLSAIRTSFILGAASYNHPISPDKKGEQHEVRFDIDFEGATYYSEGAKIKFSKGVATGEVNSTDIPLGYKLNDNIDITGHLHPVATIVGDDKKAYTFTAEEPTAADLLDFKTKSVNIISGNLERKPVILMPDGSYNTPENKKGAIFYNSGGIETMRIESKTIDNILSNYENGELKPKG